MSDRASHRKTNHRRRGCGLKYYTIYHPLTDEILAAGNLPHCARQLRITVDTLYCYLSRARRGSKRGPYIFVEEDLKTGRMRTWPRGE